ncbi:MAG TPA: hypothetical protein DCQ06_03030 [Myxococcales bacterium]|nr:hypothetical protein [Myxococcales bacterium]
MSEAEWVLAQGGWAGYALAAVSILLWTSVIVRALTLQFSGPVAVDASQCGNSALAMFLRDAFALREHPARLERLAQRTVEQLSVLRSFIRTLVTVAPLLGLLGTVIGMVEMFSSMQGAAAVDAETTLAGGISTALISTQLGLTITVPGLLAAHLLQRLQLRRQRDVHSVVQAHGGASS